MLGRVAARLPVTGLRRSHDLGPCFEELLEACVALGVRIIVCTMGLKAVALDETALRTDLGIETGGLVTFLTDARADGSIMFV